MTETKCQTCGRRPSERYGLHNYPKRVAMSPKPCTDPIHDLADRGHDGGALLREQTQELDRVIEELKRTRYPDEIPPHIKVRMLLDKGDTQG